MSGEIGFLMAAIKGEVDRIAHEKAEESQRDVLSDLLLESIHKTLREIKMGAESDEFQDRTVLNFVVAADSAGHATETIKSFVAELKTAKSARPERSHL